VIGVAKAYARQGELLSELSGQPVGESAIA
jgi:hypothetical protein